MNTAILCIFAWQEASGINSMGLPSDWAQVWAARALLTEEESSLGIIELTSQ